MTDYPRDFGQQVGARSGLPADLAARADEIEGTTTETVTSEIQSVELVSDDSLTWYEVIDLALKALLVIVAFGIATRL